MIYENNLVKFIILYCIFCLSNSSCCATPIHDISFFYSNNTQIIDIKSAYYRLIGAEQIELKKISNKILNTQYIGSGQRNDFLGVYTMASNQMITAENSESFEFLPKKTWGKKQTILAAAALANRLEQESVAVFIHSDSNQTAELKLIFGLHRPTITETINLLSQRLPKSYTHAFSLHLMNTTGAMYRQKVRSVEWLGHFARASDVRKAFPHDKVSTKRGSSFLVYKNSTIKPL